MATANQPEISIVILSYNVKELLLKCLKSVFASLDPKKHPFQVIVVDNASADASAEAVAKAWPQVKIIKSRKNVGFSSGNNLAVPYLKGEFVLFLNPDTIIVDDAIGKSLEKLKSCPEVAALTCRVELPSGRMDYSCHRGLPTPWNSFWHFYFPLSRLFPRSRLFAGYKATYLDIKTTHLIDCISGVFFLIRRKVAEEVGWWDEDFFFNGEDVDFCFRLKAKGRLILFYPEVKIIHFKGSSSGLWSTAGTGVNKETKLLSAVSAIKAMRLFYQKHYLKKYGLFSLVVYSGIWLLEKIRLAKINLGIKYE